MKYPRITLSLCFFIMFFCFISNAQNPLKVGQRVEVNVSAHWYKSTILAINGDKYKVHYDGYGSTDDSWVYFTQIRRLATADKAVNENCDFTVSTLYFTNDSAPSDALFQKKIYDYYAMAVNKGLSSPTAIGIKYITFRRNPGYVNTQSTLPGSGTNRRHNGAPVNANIYPVRVSFYICKKYKDNSITQDEVNCDFSFFKNAGGEWTSSKDN